MHGLALIDGVALDEPARVAQLLQRHFLGAEPVRLPERLVDGVSHLERLQRHPQDRQARIRRGVGARLHLGAEEAVALQRTKEPRSLAVP